MQKNMRAYCILLSTHRRGPCVVCCCSGREKGSFSRPGEAGVVRTYCTAAWFVYGCGGEVAEAGAQAAPPGAGCVGLCGDARATRLVQQTDTGTY
jgi:hypothetical protein